MTIDEFIVNLGRLRYKKSGKPLLWELDHNKIRAFFKDSHTAKLCPITAVGYAESRIYFQLYDSRGANQYLNLSREDIQAITLAADFWAYRDQTSYDRALRSRLLTACGLPVQTP